MIRADAINAIATKKYRCQPEPDARKLKAAPGLYASTRDSTGGNTSMDCPGATARCMTIFVIWSSTTSTALKPNQMRRLRMNAVLPRAIQIFRATAADVCMEGINADVGAVVPAALAFRVLTRRDDDAVPVLYDLGLGCDEHEAQIVTQGLQQFEPV